MHDHSEFPKRTSLSTAGGVVDMLAIRAPNGAECGPPPMPDAPDESPLIRTVGHSARPLPDFIALLQAYGITLLIDVRKMPRSRSNPQFNCDSLPEQLAKVGIKYRHLPGLGGLRRPRPDSPNGGWRNRSFQGYADYMRTPEFAENLGIVLEAARHDAVALMCAEAVPWRCHRSLIADALTVRGARVQDILSITRSQQHVLTSWARVEGDTVIYPPESALLTPGGRDHEPRI